MDVAAARAAIATALNTVADLRAYNYFDLAPDPPAAIIYPDTIPAEETMGGLRRPVMVVRLYAPMGDPEAGTRVMDAWVSTATATSVIDRITDHLSGYSAASPDVRNYQPATLLSGIDVLMCELVFDVF